MSLKLIQIPPTASPSIGTVVVLHGWGANAPDAAYFTQMLELANILLILPEGPWQHPFSIEGRMWYGLPDPLESFDFEADLSADPELQASRSQLLELLQLLPEKTGIPLERTILGGFSQGSAMAIDLAFDASLTLPLAGLMVLSGYKHKSLAGIQSNLPVLMVHGKQDPVVPLKAAQQTHAAIMATGATVQYEEFDNMGHEVSLAVLDRMKTFIHTTLT
jgi:phospholipase/carboxylesterase